MANANVTASPINVDDEAGHVCQNVGYDNGQGMSFDPERASRMLKIASKMFRQIHLYKL